MSTSSSSSLTQKSLTIESNDRPVVPRHTRCPHLRKKLRLSLATSVGSSVSVVGRALLPVDDSDGQECPSYEDHGCVKWRLVKICSQMKFQASSSSIRSRIMNFWALPVTVRG